MVTNARNGPIAGACVYWGSATSNYGTAKSRSDGSYSIVVLANSPVTLTANHSLYEWKSLTIPNPILAAATPQNFEKMKYLLTTSVAPWAFNNSPQKTLTFSTYSTAPQSGTRVVVRLPSGSFIDLSFDTSYTDPAGWKRWTGSWTVPAGTADGAYTDTSCAIDSAATVGCDPVTSLVLSQVKSATYKVDSVPPSFSGQSPVPNHNTILLRPSVSVLLADSLSGVDAATPKLTLDGNQVAAFFDPVSGRLSFSPGTDLALGVHALSASTSDIAGNSSSTTWQFDVVSISASAASATVASTTVPVNPNQSIPPPSSVTISAAPTTLASFNLSLTSSSWVGRGTLVRQVTYTGLKVTLANELGQRVVVNAPAASTAFSFDIGVLETQASSLGVHVRAVSSSLPSVTVAIPSGFIVTNQSTATLWSDPQVADPVPTPKIGGDPLPLPIECGQTSCTVTGVVTCTVASPGPTYSCNGTFPRASLEGDIASVSPVNIVASLDRANTDPMLQYSSTRQKYPEPNPAEPGNCGASYGGCPNLLNSGDNVSRLTAYWATGALFRAYGNEYLFNISGNGEGRIAVWQAADVTPGSVGTTCSKLTEFGNAIDATSSSWQTTGVDYFKPTVGSLNQQFSPATEDVVLSRNDSLGNLVYRVGASGSPNNVDLSNIVDGLLYLQGSYTGADGFGRSIDPDGNQVQASGKAAFNLWTPTPNYARRHAEVMTGSEFGAPLGADYGFRAVLYFQFDYQTSGC
jgi:hypothetical protein